MTRTENAIGLELLPWDSDHFGFPVARLGEQTSSGAVLREMLRTARETGGPPGLPGPRIPGMRSRTGCSVNSPAGGWIKGHVRMSTCSRVPKRRLPSRALTKSPRYPLGNRPDDLSAWHWRRGSAPGFDPIHGSPPRPARRLYEVWITRSTLRELADAVLVISRTGEAETIPLA